MRVEQRLNHLERLATAKVVEMILPSTALIQQRVNLGWTIKRAVVTPPYETYEHLTLYGTTRSVAEWTRLCHFKPSTIPWRLKMGWTVEKALCTPLKRKKDRYG